MGILYASQEVLASLPIDIAIATSLAHSEVDFLLPSPLISVS